MLIHYKHTAAPHAMIETRASNSHAIHRTYDGRGYIPLYNFSRISRAPLVLAFSMNVGSDAFRSNFANLDEELFLGFAFLNSCLMMSCGADPHNEMMNDANTS